MRRFQEFAQNQITLAAMVDVVWTLFQHHDAGCGKPGKLLQPYIPWTMQVFQVMDRPALPFEDAVQSPSVGKPKEGFLLNEVSPFLWGPIDERYVKLIQIVIYHDGHDHDGDSFWNTGSACIGGQLILCTNVMWYSVPSCDWPGKKSPLPHLGSLSNLPPNRINMCTANKLHMWLWGNMPWNEKTHNHS